MFITIKNINGLVLTVLTINKEVIFHIFIVEYIHVLLNYY